MPLYDYRCEECKHEFTKVLKMSERAEPKKSPCPECGESDCIITIIKKAPIVGYSVAPNMKTTNNFNDRLKEMKKKVGKGHTLTNSIRNG